ncbi:hypothetical protein [Cardinium endosymbiont of Tipula unca]|uniref:hypothetical protein n=1 Tax=Cardinium endosymbiont of Tipula unca TaxID=3066216 RepID=UPI0030CBFFE7
MKYTWSFILLFLGIGAPICYADTQSGEIKDAEFIIEKQKKNKVNQEKKLFFKAPTKSINKTEKPLKEVRGLTLELLPFDPDNQSYIFFDSKQESIVVAPLDNYCKLGVSSLLLPYTDICITKISFLQGIWSTNGTFIPGLFGMKARKGLLGVQGAHTIAAWLLSTDLNYQADWHQYADKNGSPERILHLANVDLHAKTASDFSSQEGQITYHPLAFHHEQITEQLFTLKYKWIKPLDNLTFKVSTYNDMAWYKNHALQKTRVIFSAAPIISLSLPKDFQLKAGLWVTYHNEPVSGKIPSFDFYPMLKINRPVLAWLHPYVGIEGMGIGGNTRPLHLRDVVQKNPFVAKNCNLSHSHQYLKLQGGSKGKISDNFSYHLNIGYRNIKHLSRIVATRDADNYTLLYLPTTHRAIKITGLLNYAIPIANLSTAIKITYYNYFKDHAAPIWWYNKPAYKFNPTLLYKLHPKILLKGGLDLRGGTTVKDILGNATELEATADLSLGGEYTFSEKFVAFLLVSNLFNSNNLSYTRYAGKKATITGGIQYKW